MPNININSTGHILEWGSITTGVAFNVPGVDLTAVVDADNTAQVGAGSPEGVATARHANDLYKNSTDGHVWYHASGTGNTGWVDATAAAPPAGPTLLSAVGVDMTDLVAGSILVWDATNKRLHLAPATAIADATDATSVITQLNALLALLRTKGVIAP